jgi:t-SNARE complex subunit (syntaxin)
MSCSAPLVRELRAQVAVYERIVAAVAGVGLAATAEVSGQRSRVRGSILALKRQIRREHAGDEDVLAALAQAMQEFRVVNEHWRVARGDRPALDCEQATAAAGNDNDATLGAARQQARITTGVLQGALSDLVAAREVGEGAMGELVDQEAALDRVRAATGTMESELAIATRLATRVLKRAYTDKLLVAGACVVCVAIVMIVVLKMHFNV